MGNIYQVYQRAISVGYDVVTGARHYGTFKNRLTASWTNTEHPTIRYHGNRQIMYSHTQEMSDFMLKLSRLSSKSVNVDTINNLTTIYEVLQLRVYFNINFAHKFKLQTLRDTK